MTEDFKEKILKYLVGKYDISETKFDIPSFSNLSTETTNLITQLDEAFPNGYIQTDYVLTKDNKGNNNGYVLVYGNYYIDNTKTTTRSYILLLDNVLNLLQIFTKYSSNVDFETIQLIDVDNEGNTYLIEEKTQGKRLVLLNNMSIKRQSDAEYSATIRIAYPLQGNIANANKVVKMKKSPGSGRYLFVGKQDNNNTPLVTEFVINVGSTNEWNNYTCDETLSKDFIIKDLYASWDEDDNLLFDIIGANITFIAPDENDFINGDIVSLTNQNTLPNKMLFHIDISKFQDYFFKEKNGIPRKDIDIKIKEFGDFYISIGGTCIWSGDEYTSGIVILRNFFGLILKISERQSGLTSRNSANCTALTKLFNINNQIFVLYLFNDILLNQLNVKYSVNVQWCDQIPGNEPLNLGATNIESLNKFNIILIKNEFNLFKFYCILNVYNYDTLNYEYKKLSTYLIYNSLNYNGFPRQDYDSMIPNSGVLYDNNGLVLFARNLYNKTINNNTTTSVLEVPNTMLNDVEIAKEDLIGKENNILIENNQSIFTNIYETLNINFYNTLLMKNSNNKQNEILNPTGASRLNYDISANGTEDSYNNTKGTKLKINFDDNTSFIQTIDTTTQVEIINNMAIIDFTIYVPTDKNITNIQIISNDEITIYQEITNLSMENGKFYQLTQMVEVI